MLFLIMSAVEATAAPGSTAENFLKIGLAPRPVSMGEAFVGVADDVNAISYNPAGLALLRRQEAALTHNEYVQGIRQEYMAYAFPGEGWGTLGLSANLLKVSPFPAYDANDVPADSVSAQDMALSAAYAVKYRSLALGVAGKYLNSRLDTVKARGKACDLGVLWSPHWQFRFGAALQNLGPSVRFIDEGFPLPLAAKLGFSYLAPLSPGNAYLLVAAGGSFPSDRAPFPSAGLEFVFSNLVSARVGYQGDQDAGMGLTVGAGVKLFGRGFTWLSYSEFPEWAPEMELDYAFVGMGMLGNVHRVGILVRFGNPTRRQDDEPKTFEPYQSLFYGR